MCGKEHQLIFASAARTATVSATAPCKSTQGLFFINVSALTAGASIVFKIEGVSPAGSSVYTILESAAVVATGLTVLRVSPHLTAAANTIAKDMLPSEIKVTATHADNKSVTYEVRFVGME